MCSGHIHHCHSAPNKLPDFLKMHNPEPCWALLSGQCELPSFPAPYFRIWRRFWNEKSTISMASLPATEPPCLCLLWPQTDTQSALSLELGAEYWKHTTSLWWVWQTRWLHASPAGFISLSLSTAGWSCLSPWKWLHASTIHLSLSSGLQSPGF